jgi:hypothetical protein
MFGLRRVSRDAIRGSPRNRPRKVRSGHAALHVSSAIDSMDIWQTIQGSAGSTSVQGAPSVPDVARQHADAHRWFVSERSGRDVGGEAYREWRQRYWRTFCRWRYLEHLLGICCYRDYEPHTFGTLRQQQGWTLDQAMAFALQQVLQDDREQVEVLFHAPDELPRHRLVEVLSLLDVNGARLSPPEWTDC